MDDTTNPLHIVLNRTQHTSFSYPIYYNDSPQLLPFMSDRLLAVFFPTLVYWAISIPFDILDRHAPKWIEKYRINESAEESSRNRVSKKSIILTVMSQQVVQSIIGVLFLEDRVKSHDHLGEISKIQSTLAAWLLPLLGLNNTVALLSPSNNSLAASIYWWAIPLVQFAWAFFVIDTWQYCLHRFMHNVPFLYKHCHSWHHRLYIPYAFGALYNHPVEGLLLDIIGAVLSYDLSSMTARQGFLLFGFSTAKTVHDHCGWSLPWDPMQFMFQNNAAYHDVHHQTIGIKSNFAQPFFVHWDALLGTKMTREEMEARRTANREKLKTA